VTVILRKQIAFLQEFFGDLLSGVEFGHHDLQTSHHLTYFCGDFLKKKSLAQYLKETEQAVFGTDLQTVQKVAIGTVKLLNASLQEGRGTIPASAIITQRHSLMSLKNKNNYFI
jgi:hypothetical protein